MLRVAILYAALLVTAIVVADCHWLPQVVDRFHEVPLLDKVLHFLLFGSLALVTNLALVQRGTSPRRAIVIGCTIALVVATVEEYSNRFVPARDWSLGDLAANYLGVVCLGLLPLWRRGPGECDEAVTEASPAPSASP